MCIFIAVETILIIYPPCFVSFFHIIFTELICASCFLRTLFQEIDESNQKSSLC